VRLVTLVIMLLFTLMATLFSDHILDPQKYKWFVGLYALIRLIQAFKYYYVACIAVKSKLFARRIAWLFFGGAVLVIPTIFLDSDLKACFLVGIIVCEMVALCLVTNTTEVMPAHQGHLVERIGLLSIILLGESIIAMVGGLRGAHWELGSVFSTVAGFSLIAFIWWVYFDSFPYLERAKRFGHGFAFVYSHFAFFVGLILLANLILRTITGEIYLDEFRTQSIVGMSLFYFGKQFSYFVYFPTYRLNQMVNSVICIGITAVSVFSLQPKTALLGITFGMAVYAFLNLYWTLQKDASEYLLPETL